MLSMYFKDPTGRCFSAGRAVGLGLGLNFTPKLPAMMSRAFVYDFQDPNVGHSDPTWNVAFPALDRATKCCWSVDLGPSPTGECLNWRSPKMIHS